MFSLLAVKNRLFEHIHGGIHKAEPSALSWKSNTLTLTGDLRIEGNAIVLNNMGIGSNLIINEASSTRLQVRNAANNAHRDLEVRDLYYYDNILTNTSEGEIRANGASAACKVSLTAWDLNGSAWVETAAWHTNNDPYFEIPKSGSIIPALDLKYAIGSPSVHFANVYAGGIQWKDSTLTGSTTCTLGTNSPSAATTPVTWQRVTILNSASELTAGFIPVFV